ANRRLVLARVPPRHLLLLPPPLPPRRQRIARATPPHSPSNAAATITMDEFNFTGPTSVTIKAGQAMNFDDTNGSTHMLVIGTIGVFQAQNGAPPELNNGNGITVNGDAKTITFPTADTYKITCTIHPEMLATVTVK